ncbi:glutathione S-transferase 4-like [Pollicipes pollicipes]|uniref:glutathione S-transferase 4-like n=1 Tax=Pollicipes pollicipes TaxID=41117 RepID=UPI001884A6C0|nr:glutathione S-transferase 4-like [Pollicipes pollicipes]XP_037072175.1 glutathione S-transferase 4-like [Pollicipes pollicipes]
MGSSGKMAVDLYHALWSPPSRAVRMIGRAVGVRFNLITCEPIQGDHLKPDFLKMNPMHTIPTINDNGFVLWESRAIGQYLVSKYAPQSTLIPTDLQQKALYDQRLFFDYAMLQNFSKTMRRIFVGGTRFEPKDIKQCRTSLQLLDQFLSQSTYVAGERITLVDYTAAASVITCQPEMVDLSTYPHVQRWLARVRTEIDGFEEINGPGVEMIGNVIGAVLSSDGDSSKL